MSYFHILRLATSTGYGGCLFAALTHKRRQNFMKVTADDDQTFSQSFLNEPCVEPTYSDVSGLDPASQPSSTFALQRREHRRGLNRPPADESTQQRGLSAIATRDYGPEDYVTPARRPRVAYFDEEATIPLEPAIVDEDDFEGFQQFSYREIGIDESMVISQSRRDEHGFGPSDSFLVNEREKHGGLYDLNDDWSIKEYNLDQEGKKVNKKAGAACLDWDEDEEQPEFSKTTGQLPSYGAFMSQSEVSAQRKEYEMYADKRRQELVETFNQGYLKLLAKQRADEAKDELDEFDDFDKTGEITVVEKKSDVDDITVLQRKVDEKTPGFAPQTGKRAIFHEFAHFSPPEGKSSTPAVPRHKPVEEPEPVPAPAPAPVRETIWGFGVDDDDEEVFDDQENVLVFQEGENEARRREKVNLAWIKREETEKAKLPMQCKYMVTGTADDWTNPQKSRLYERTQTPSKPLFKFYEDKPARRPKSPKKSPEVDTPARRPKSPKKFLEVDEPARRPKSPKKRLEVDEPARRPKSPKKRLEVDEPARQSKSPKKRLEMDELVQLKVVPQIAEFKCDSPDSKRFKPKKSSSDRRGGEWDLKARREKRASVPREEDVKRQLPPAFPKRGVQKSTKESSKIDPCGSPLRDRSPLLPIGGVFSGKSHFLDRSPYTGGNNIFPHFQLPIRSVLEFKDFLLCYDTQTKSPVWTLEHVTKENLKEMPWYPPPTKKDSKIPSEFQAGKQDYWKAMNKFRELQLAHVGLHADNAEDTCVYTNVAPQATGGKSHGAKTLWTELQDYTVHLLKKHDHVWILSGVLYLPKRNKARKLVVNYQTIGKQKVAVPSHFFKVILATTKNCPGFRLECYKFENEVVQDLSLSCHHVPRSELEMDAGFKIFDGVEDAQVTINYTDVHFRPKQLKPLTT